MFPAAQPARIDRTQRTRRNQGMRRRRGKVFRELHRAPLAQAAAQGLPWTHVSDPSEGEPGYCPGANRGTTS